LAGTSGSSGTRGTSGSSGTSGTSGSSGVQGNKGGLQYEYDTGLSITSPTVIGMGHIRANSLTASSITQLFIHRRGIEGITVDHFSFINTWDDSNSTIKGYLVITENSNSGTNYLILQITSLGTYDSTNSAFPINVNYISGTLPVDATRCSVQFYRTGDDGGSGVSNVSFYSNGSNNWSKPTGCNVVKIVLIGAGGGGGSGAKGTFGTGGNPTYSNGGGGGGGGAIVELEVSASSLASTVSYAVGAGGTGGASRTVTNSDGLPGGNGGNTTFGPYIARGGSGGGGGKYNDIGSNGGAAGGGGMTTFIGSNGQWTNISANFPSHIIPHGKIHNGLPGASAPPGSPGTDAVSWFYNPGGGGSGGGGTSDANVTAGGLGGGFYSSAANTTAGNSISFLRPEFHTLSTTATIIRSSLANTATPGTALSISGSYTLIMAAAVAAAAAAAVTDLIVARPAAMAVHHPGQSHTGAEAEPRDPPGRAGQGRRKSPCGCC